MQTTVLNPKLARVLFIDDAHPILKEQLQQLGFRCESHPHFTYDQLVENLIHYEGVVIRSKIKLSREIIDKAVNLKFIARVGAGMENIDSKWAIEKGISCLNAPEGNRDAVAEHTIGMLLSLFNNLNRADREVRKAQWHREANRGVELKGKTVAIIGFGNMGSAFAERLCGFGCNILAYDKYKASIDNPNVKLVAMETIYEHADICSFHIPLTAETNYLIDDNYLSNFKKPIYIINTSRGKILNTDALVKNLKSGSVRGACLDVLEYETLSFEHIDAKKIPESFHYLIQSEKVVLSPHIAGWTYESAEKMATILVEKIKELYKIN